MSLCGLPNYLKVWLVKTVPLDMNIPVTGMVKIKTNKHNNQTNYIDKKCDKRKMSMLSVVIHKVLQGTIIFHYYTSCEFPIQSFHRRTTDIL